jgi:hypothetical protein
LAANEQARCVAESALHGVLERRSVEIDLRISAVKGYDRGRPIIELEKWQQVHPDVPEINVHELRVRAPKFIAQPVRLGSVNHDRLPKDSLLPEASQLMGARLREDRHIIKGKTLRILALLAKHHGFPRLQSRDLPINMQHLRLEKGNNVLNSNKWHFDNTAACDGRCASTTFARSFVVHSQETKV